MCNIRKGRIFEECLQYQGNRKGTRAFSLVGKGGGAGGESEKKGGGGRMKNNNRRAFMIG